MQYIIKNTKLLFRKIRLIKDKLKDYKFFKTYGIYRKDMTDEQKKIFDYLYNDDNIDYSNIKS